MVLPVTGKVENGAAMVPVAAVAQALGYEVTYTPGETSWRERRDSPWSPWRTTPSGSI